MTRSLLVLPILLFISALMFFPAAVDAQPLTHQPDAISGGAEAAGLASRVIDYAELKGSPVAGFPDLAFVPGVGFKAYNFDDNGTETGFIFIPPDPCGAVGTDRVLAVVNVGIECRTKTGTLIFRDALKDFFSPVSTLGTFTFDPKVVYDHYENRFVVVTLERWFASNGDPSDESRILVAVSKTSTPATATSSDWWFLEINSKTQIGSDWYWADYPGFEVDEEAIYITNNMFPFSTGTSGVRLWIVDKGVAGGFYAGSAASWNVYDPIPASYFALTCQPALVFGAGGAGTNIGTYLVGYSGLTDGTNEYVQIIRINNPLTGPTFSGQFINVGNLESFGGNLPDAPQLGTASLIEVNDQRTLDAVWRNNNLWFTTTIEPNSGVDAGQATAHWFRVNTTTPATLSLTDQGSIGGEDIATGASTFFPALAVNVLGDVKFGFSASAATIYAGAYYAGREAGDPAGTVQGSGVVQAGLDYYLRTFGAGRNRWGDYSGAAVDPSDDTTFWIFNEYAETRGGGTPPEDGRWGTAWRQCLKQSTLDFGDAPDPTYPTLLANNGAAHTIIPGMSMGAMVDGEVDGQPTIAADGDDIAVSDDEDGVVFTSTLDPTTQATVDVTVSVSGFLDAWIDFDANGVWDPSDQIFGSTPVGPGLNSLQFNVPGTSNVAYTTYARFRYSSIGGLAPAGAAPDGEVEDYEVQIEEDLVTDASGGDAPSHYALHDAVPNPFNPRTTLSFALPTASHVKLTIYDVRGHLVATLVDQDHGPGIYNVSWEGRDSQGRAVASGVYLYRIEAGSFNETKRMVLLK